GGKECAIVIVCRANAAAAGVSTLSLHDALPISASARWVVTESVHGPRVRVGSAAGGWAEVVFWGGPSRRRFAWGRRLEDVRTPLDRKSTRLNSSHVKISYAVCCLKKKSGERLVR